MNAIRCCIACILPFGALDVIRIIHANGHVEELARTVRASDLMATHPMHVVKSIDSLVLPPTAELKKGHIYILVPVEKKERRSREGAKRRKNGSGRDCSRDHIRVDTDVDRYLSEIMSEKASESRRGRVGVWRPHLESISEVLSE